MDAFAPNSPFKIVHHPDRVAAMREGRQPAPLQVQIVLADLCNQHCSFCAYRTPGYPSNELFPHVDPVTGVGESNPRRFLPTPKALEILDDCKELGVKAIDFTGGGEPTLHPAHTALFARTLALGLDLALMTNGTRLGGPALDLLAQAKFVRFSLDAGTPATYARIRRAPPEVFAVVTRHIAALAARRDPAGDLEIGVNFVVTRENWTELGLAARQARDLGASYFRIAALATDDGARYYGDLLGPIGELCDQARALEAPGFRVFGQLQSRVRTLAEGRPDYRYCGHMQLNTFVGADQNVYRCCTLAYNTRGLVGSIAQRRFADLWRAPDKQAGFEGFDARGCRFCPVNDKNRFINYLLEKAPRHVNFV
jgi:MoaA/NifB/PqqE/SkfB family radical SAM enzyme